MTTKQADITKENTSTIQPFISIIFHQYGNDIVSSIKAIYEDSINLNPADYISKYDETERKE